MFLQSMILTLGSQRCMQVDYCTVVQTAIRLWVRISTAIMHNDQLLRSYGNVFVIHDMWTLSCCWRWRENRWHSSSLAIRTEYAFVIRAALTCYCWCFNNYMLSSSGVYYPTDLGLISAEITHESVRSLFSEFDERFFPSSRGHIRIFLMG